MLSNKEKCRTRITGSDTQPYLQEFFKDVGQHSAVFQCFPTKKCRTHITGSDTQP